jgi:hypothetical protein
MAPEEVIQEFPCSEPGCDQKVQYKKEVVPVLSKEEKVVYLMSQGPH